ncbi:hypothetical protein CDAR_442801 [Caerostris darwini]|uniref:Uncharacterized protein n=1 Tax=Caerostris darwini TaxID=1538125 RepID=A0AAV4VML8_9ARAC|nr:hypothetical protein CDAR_442801 [Caerostris darwini]
MNPWQVKRPYTFQCKSTSNRERKKSFQVSKVMIIKKKYEPLHFLDVTNNKRIISERKKEEILLELGTFKVEEHMFQTADVTLHFRVTNSLAMEAFFTASKGTL